MAQFIHFARQPRSHFIAGLAYGNPGMTIKWSFRIRPIPKVTVQEARPDYVQAETPDLHDDRE